MPGGKFCKELPPLDQSTAIHADFGANRIYHDEFRDSDPSEGDVSKCDVLVLIPFDSARAC